MAASFKNAAWGYTLINVALQIHVIRSVNYIVGDLQTCKRVPNEPPCNVPYQYFVPDYISKRYHIIMELIYRRSRDIQRLDSRRQCIDAYQTFLCAQLIPRCKKQLNPRYESLDLDRWIVHDTDIMAKCFNIFASCNNNVASRFMSEKYFLCDHLNYVPEGWRLNRCVHYDLDTRCTNSYGQLPQWYLNYHDQNLVEYLNATWFRVNKVLPETCVYKIFNTLCRHPTCSRDKRYLISNYTRQQCQKYLMCAKYVPGEVNVDAICLSFPSSAKKLTTYSIIPLITLCLLYTELFHLKIT